MLKKIQEWLANPKRKYAEGLKYFNELANPKQKASFGEYLNAAANKDVEQFDVAGRFPVLINQVLFCEKRLKSSPEEFAGGTAATVKITAVNTDGLSGKEKGPGTTGSGDVNPPKNPPITDLSQLPENFAPVVARLKDIVPLMAKMHADMAAATADDARAELRKMLIKLDDERRAIWDRVNEFLAGKQEVHIEKDDQERAVEENMLVMGRDLAMKMGQLKGYITRNKQSLEKHTKVGDEKKAAASREKIAEYSKQLAELQALFPEK